MNSTDFIEDFFVPLVGVAAVITIICGSISCEPQRPKTEKRPYIQHEYEIRNMIPDSLQPKYTQTIKEIVSAASLHMTGGDYEDPEDVVSKAAYLAEDMYTRQVEGLYIQHFDVRKDLTNSYFIPYNRLDSVQRLLFKEAKDQYDFTYKVNGM